MNIFKPPYQSGGRAYYIHHYTPDHSCMHVCAFCGIQDNILHKRFLSNVVFQSRCWFLKNEYCLTSLSVQSWQYRDRRKPEAGTMPYSYFEWLQGFFIVHSTTGSTIHSRPLNSLEHCICTTTTTNIRPDRDSNLVPPGYRPQSIRMSHRGRPLISKARKVKNGAIVFPSNKKSSLCLKYWGIYDNFWYDVMAAILIFLWYM